MQTMLPGRRSFRNSRSHRVGTVGMGVLLLLVLSGTALGQQPRVSGTVTASGGGPLAGVIVRVEGTDTSTFTNANGRYSIAAPAEGVLLFTVIGRRPVRAPIAGRTTIDVVMERIAYLEEVVVTGYTEQRRADITGAVASVNVESADRQTTASVLQRLDANVSGVTVDAGGSPGSRSTVRVRGFTSFQNNDPLYVVDGTPVQESYINWLNPNDIESIQVLKDASAASIYGARASSGVVIVETTKGGARGRPRATLSVRTGITRPVRGYDDFLITDAMEYFEVVKRSYLNAGYPIDSVPSNIYGNANNPTLPRYIWPNNCGPDESPAPCPNVDENSYSFPGNLIMPASRGTNWWDEVFGTGSVGDYNLSISGAGDNNTYGLSFNYFDQQGTALYNSFKRGSVRVNTSFKPGRLTFGENLAIAVERSYGGLPDDPPAFAEEGILGKNILMQPIVPVRDVAGNFASGKAVGLGNQSNPVKWAVARKDDLNRNDRVFGNAFVGYDVLPDLQVLSRFGFNLGRSSFTGFTPSTPENSEPTDINTFTENWSQFTDWTWSNTLTYRREVLQNHNLSLLLGQEANQTTNRFIVGAIPSLLNTAPSNRYLQDALGDAAGKNVNSLGSRSALLSFFGKADYNFADRYVLSFTLRHDGSSNLGPSHRWGTFPAFGLGWRLTNESFFPESRVFSDVMLRFGWGVTGNQLIPSGRIVSQFGGSVGDTYYDIGGTNTNVQAGFRQTSLGNVDLKWEENTSANIGADVALFDGDVEFVLDVYQRETDNLLFDPPTPGTAGVASPPIVNIGQMRNRGFDFSIGHRGPTWTVVFNASHYRNKILRVSGQQDFFFGPISTRFGNQVINQVGQPIGSFYGFIADGLFRDSADVENHADQDGAAPGRIKFRDVCCGPNGEMVPDGRITPADKTIIGSPHPDFTAGLDVGFRWRNWDLNATLFGTFGNDIFDAQKEYYVFRNFSTNVRRDLLTDSWTPENPNAKYPRLDVNDNYSRAISSFYVEDGSYVRLRNVRIGYNVPQSMAQWLPVSRIYLQGENLFTITGYDGLDPALPAANVVGPAGDIRDQYRGVDRGSYPSNKMFSVGVIANF
jgi:TonB-linked SusC/RagA family outer membrane protein